MHASCVPHVCLVCASCVPHVCLMCASCVPHVRMPRVCFDCMSLVWLSNSCSSVVFRSSMSTSSPFLNTTMYPKSAGQSDGFILPHPPLPCSSGFKCSLDFMHIRTYIDQRADPSCHLSHLPPKMFSSITPLVPDYCMHNTLSQDWHWLKSAQCGCGASVYGATCGLYCVCHSSGQRDVLQPTSSYYVPAHKHWCTWCCCGCDSDRLARRFADFRHFISVNFGQFLQSMKVAKIWSEQPKCESEMRSFLSSVKKHESYQTCLAATAHTVQNYLLHFTKIWHEPWSSGSRGVPNALCLICEVCTKVYAQPHHAVPSKIAMSKLCIQYHACVCHSYICMYVCLYVSMYVYKLHT